MKRVLSALLSVLQFVSFQGEALAGESDAMPESYFRIEMRNRSNAPASLVLAALQGEQVYRLELQPGERRAFTVRAGVYAQTTYACGGSATGTLDVSRQLRLTFIPCAGAAPNAGAPTLEKIHLVDAPLGLKWRYQYGPLLKGLAGSGGGIVIGTCEYTANAEVTIYTRPDPTASEFSVQPAGFTAQPGARSANGWLGFDPGVAQAANIGPFRLRWLPPGSGTVTPGCTSLPVIWTPAAGLCYDMPMSDTNVYQNPDTNSAVLFVLHMGEFAEVLGLAPGGDWAQVDLGPGNTGSQVVGWVESSSLNVNGPCSDPPVINP
jgi:hypothetical protein